LGYFARDLRELLASAFIKDGPGTLNGPWSDGRYRLKTAVSDEETRSFVTIYRRLYMDNEPANFVKAVKAFSEALQGYALAKWVQGIATKYETALEAEPDFVPVIEKVKLSFSRKRLIEVFLYTQYALLASFTTAWHLSGATCWPRLPSRGRNSLRTGALRSPLSVSLTPSTPAIPESPVG
jgi:hypothetical protein